VAAIVTATFVGGCGESDDAPKAPRPSASTPAAASPAVVGPARPTGAKVFPASAARFLDDPSRDIWQRPDEVVAALGIRPGQRVADVGCGTGYFTLRLLRVTGAAGHVLATDVQQEMLDILERRLDAAEKARVTLRRNAPDRPLEAADAVDLVFCANTLYEVDEVDAERFVKSMANGLAPGGRLAVLDWKPERMRLGPPLEIRISSARISDLARKAGLSPTEDIALLPTHSFLVFTKAK
jgi:SAM-dependent methyltransferase